MITFHDNKTSLNCEKINRRNFLKVGALGASTFLLSDYLQAAPSNKKKSVIWIWLDGGATHIETFDPKPTATEEYRSVTDAIATKIPGLYFGGTFPKLASIADQVAIIRSFSHKNSGHAGGTHWIYTGYDNTQVDNGGASTKPSIGSIVAKYRGISDPSSGVPNYIKLNGKNQSEGPAWLGQSYAPFDPNGEAKKNLELHTSMDRLNNRKELLNDLDQFRRSYDKLASVTGVTDFQNQAFETIVGKSTTAFDLSKETKETLESYGNGLGKQLLLARRLVENGTSFVTVNYGGWDMHSNIKEGMLNRSPELDHALYTLITDLKHRNMSDDVLVVVTGEFGRTPKINATGGRDHWPGLSPLMIYGGGMKMGQVIGESDDKISSPTANSPIISPLDLMSTIFHVLDIPKNLQYTDTAGRPTYMLEGGSPIKQLV